MEKAYTKPIEDAQKKLLGANSEIIKLKALIKELKNELATKAVDKGLGVIATPEPEKKFYDLFMSLAFSILCAHVDGRRGWGLGEENSPVADLPVRSKAPDSSLIDWF